MTATTTIDRRGHGSAHLSAPKRHLPRRRVTLGHSQSDQSREPTERTDLPSWVRPDKGFV
jgi:hypothetical protein